MQRNQPQIENKQITSKKAELTLLFLIKALQICFSRLNIRIIKSDGVTQKYSKQSKLLKWVDIQLLTENLGKYTLSVDMITSDDNIQILNVHIKVSW